MRIPSNFTQACPYCGFEGPRTALFPDCERCGRADPWLGEVSRRRRWRLVFGGLALALLMVLFALAMDDQSFP